jgi:hypothetical protein
VWAAKVLTHLVRSQEAHDKGAYLQSSGDGLKFPTTAKNILCTWYLQVLANIQTTK